MQKQCFKCGRTLDLEQFYKHKEMADGHLNKCKDCTKNDVAKRYVGSREKVRAYEKKRFQDPSRKAKVAEYQRRRRKREPLKDKARAKLWYAILTGKITKPKNCQLCGSEDRIEAHHPDYEKPLDVEWLCFKCHREHGHGQTVGEREEAVRELRERSDAIRSGILPVPEKEAGESDEAYLTRVAKERREAMQPVDVEGV